MDKLKKFGNMIAPPPQKDAEGRDQWPSRTAFILASLSGVIGMGNFLRYPSTVFNNHGLQWFIPYLLALFLLAVPALALELAAGNAYRGGTVTAFNKISRRMRGTGFALNYVGLVVSIYFIPIIAWGMVFFQKSFTSPLPWAGDTENYFMYQVVSAVDPDTSGRWVDYPGIDFDGRLVGWNAFLFLLVWACMFRGTGWTGRVVYFTMGMPLIVIAILIGRGASLPNAGDGIRLYFATWRSEVLAETRIWQDAVGQVFYSTGVGFGFYTAYASYNHHHANAAQDAVILAFTNAFLEASLAFAAFGIVGFMGMTPDPENPMGSYSLGFMTYPEAFVQMPGSNFWSALFFLTLAVVGVSSTFVMLDAVMTLIMDSAFARERHWSRAWVATVLVFIVFLLSLPNCTQFGYYYMDGIDRWINNVGLVFVVWAECVSATTVYRFEDVVDQVGLPSFVIYNAGFFGAQLLSLVIGHTFSVPAGAGVGFFIFTLAAVGSVLTAKNPTVNATARLFGRNKHTSKLYYLAFYSGNQLRRDLNAVIGGSTNWSLPFIWAPLLRYFSGPILAIILSLAYPSFEGLSNDPLHVMGFIIGHFLIVWVILGFIMPGWLDAFIIPERRNDWKQPHAPDLLRDTTDGEIADSLEAGSSPNATEEKKQSPVNHNVGDRTLRENSSSSLSGDACEETNRKL
ncbi:SNF-domain-containing protein [Periconia macrospinosa]|uniref:SNF-domain-containing protein n=1 Tax=Periconia macrospinosa TaxID=97972 RepID=A0A2V1DLV5_9PLEO|nr:SNF-domain-containing protein [Periconia macrospinosa]